MPARAFIIAIEDYGKGKFLPSLAGCNRDAEIFMQWLLDKKGVKSDSILCCAGKGFKGRTNGTTSVEIIEELAKAVTNWADKTDEFYFFFSGHGFSYSTSVWEKSVDVLVASDFSDLQTGGRACLQLNEIKTKLWKSLGPKHHYYFIDACRNQIPADAISPSTTGLGFPNSQLGTPTVYKMFSTAQGAVSKTESGFTPLLVKGLSGGGRAKGLRSTRMYVIFDLLGEYMRKNLQPSGQDVDFEREGSGEGFLLELKPIPQTTCEIHVANAKPADCFTLTVRDIKGFDKEHEFKGDSFRFSLFPDDYFLELKHPSGSVLQKEPPPADPVDLYDPLVVHFELQRAATPKPAASASAVKTAGTSKKGRKGGARGIRKQELEVVITENSVHLDWASTPLHPRGFQGFRPPQAMQTRPRSLTARLRLNAVPTPNIEIEVLNLKTGEVRRSEGDFDAELAAGDYALKLRERGITVSRRQVRLKPGETKTINLLARPRDRVRATILQAVEAGNVAGASLFSERFLDPIASTDLGLWLSLFGASRILGEPGEFRKLERLRLATFEDMKRNESVVYVLAGFEKSAGGFGIGLSSGAEVGWETLEEAEGLHRIYERRLRAATGSHLLSLKIPKQSPFTFAVHCLPNRATLVTFAEDREGRLAVHQFMLPVRHLIRHLEPSAQGYLRRNMLGIVRTMTLAQSQFARKRSVQEYLKQTDIAVWNDLAEHRWLDPLMALIAAYDIIRHGTIKQASELLRLLNSNLREHFEGMADIEAIAKLIGTTWHAPAANAPLLLDGVLAFDDTQERQILPLSPDKLDYASTWTAWRGAVNDYNPPAGRSSSTRKAIKRSLHRTAATTKKKEKR